MRFSLLEHNEAVQEVQGNKDMYINGIKKYYF
jgi:hypothetical protein